MHRPETVWLTDSPVDPGGKSIGIASFFDTQRAAVSAAGRSIE
jgi:hypothetical protein